jgi:hypothetical protein
MGVSLYYTARRPVALTEAEQTAVHQVVDTYNTGTPFADAEGLNLYDRVEDGEVLAGSTKLPADEDQVVPALVHWLAAVTELRSAIPDADWHFTLDDHEIEWDDHTGYHLPGLAD